MQVLEKILEEIDKYSIEEFGHQKMISTEKAAEIIRSHMEDDGWIPVEERLPEEREYMQYEPTPYMRRLEMAYMTDTVEYLIGFYDGYKWMDKRHNIIRDVIAWKVFAPYQPKEGKNDEI